jgi:hypothetical protein
MRFCHIQCVLSHPFLPSFMTFLLAYQLYVLVSPAAGKTSAMEVLVQGKQIKAISELLISKGVPKKWIEAVDLGDKKK